MADSNHNSNSPAPTANTGQVPTDGTSAAVEEGSLRAHIDTLHGPASRDGTENQRISEADSHGQLPAAPVCRNAAGEQEGSCPLWEGHIIDATFPRV
jgi:hypothetical protein